MILSPSLFLYHNVAHLMRESRETQALQTISSLNHRPNITRETSQIMCYHKWQQKWQGLRNDHINEGHFYLHQIHKINI